MPRRYTQAPELEFDNFYQDLSGRAASRPLVTGSHVFKAGTQEAYAANIDAIRAAAESARAKAAA